MMDSQLKAASDLYESTSRKEVIIAYRGPVTDVIMSEISRDIRIKFANNAKIGRKVFAIFIELAQNILYYSAEKLQNEGNYVDRVGTIAIFDEAEKDQYSVFCCNLVELHQAQDLKRGCEVINSLGKEELRLYKREQRSRPTATGSKGAGIGLIQVAITSENNLETDFQPFDENRSFFILTARINKYK
jgi:CRISPR/Cas system-associated endoribonuclease Cas2